MEGATDRSIALLVLRRPAKMQHPLVLADVPADLAAAAGLGDQAIGHFRLALPCVQLAGQVLAQHFRVDEPVGAGRQEADRDHDP